MQVLHGEIRVSALVERVVRWMRKGDQGHMKCMQVFLVEEEKLAGQSGTS